MSVDFINKIYAILPAWKKRNLLNAAGYSLLETLQLDQKIDRHDSKGVFDDYEIRNDVSLVVDIDRKIFLLLKKTIPWDHDVANHIGDNFVNALEGAFGDDEVTFNQVLGGWDGDDQWLAEELLQNIFYYSEIYPGWKPSWGIDEIKQFFDVWRSRFFLEIIDK